MPLLKKLGVVQKKRGMPIVLVPVCKCTMIHSPIVYWEIVWLSFLINGTSTCSIQLEGP